MAKRRIGARLGSAATAGEGMQNLLCAYLAMAVFAGLAANTLLIFFAALQLFSIGLLADLVVRLNRPRDQVDPAPL